MYYFLSSEYVIMNLFPTNARRVFPCLDEFTAAAPISFSFENFPFDEMISSSQAEDDDP